MNIRIENIFSILLVFYSFSCFSCFPTISDNPLWSYWVGTGYWSVVIDNPAIICNPNSCCCFNGVVNSWINNNMQNIVYNGSVSGQCDNSVKSDDIDTPTSYNINDQEFFGIDYFDFQLQNASNGVLAIVLNAIDKSAATPKCSFQLIHPVNNVNELLPPFTPPTPVNNPCTTIPNVCSGHGQCIPIGSTDYKCNCNSTYFGAQCQNNVPSIAQPYPGLWNFDNSCNVADPTCCCLLNPVNIFADPLGSSNFYMNGTGSTGCFGGKGNNNILTFTETDDFPFPSADASNSQQHSQVTVTGFLGQNDNYIITLNNGLSSDSVNSPVQLFVYDKVKPQCSLAATRVSAVYPYVPPPSPQCVNSTIPGTNSGDNSSNNSFSGSSFAGGFFLAVGLMLIAAGVYYYRRKNCYNFNSRVNESSALLYDRNYSARTAT